MTVRRVTTTETDNTSLPYLSQKERLEVYNVLTSGVQHLWSKNKYQEDVAQNLLDALVPLTTKDPYFLASLTSYIFRQAESNKDLKVMTALVNALSSADGTPFSPGSKYLKPNLRSVSVAAVEMLDPKTASHITELEGKKWSVDGYFNKARHFPNVLKTALKKYLLYREKNPDMLRGITKSGMRNMIREMYIKLHLAPSVEAAGILRWEQKDGRKIDFEKRAFDFTDKTDLQVAKMIRKEKVPFLGALAELSRIAKKISPVIAVALLEQATGDQAVIAHKTFNDAGILKDPEVLALYEEKIRTAKNALDRVASFSGKLDEQSAKILKQARADVRKEQVGDIGKVYLHLDASGSMNAVIDFAKERGTLIAELVKNPRENFKWGVYDYKGVDLPLPDEFVADAFRAKLFGITMGGGTDCLALYRYAREFGADVDVQVTDGAHNIGDLRARMRYYHSTHKTQSKPKACVIVDFSPVGYWNDRPGSKNPVKEAYEDNGIPVAVIRPESLSGSALVVDAIKAAVKGPEALIDSIMETPLLKLPDWYMSI